MTSAEPHDPVTGEIMPIAADGRPVPGAASTFGHFIGMLEEGQLTVDLANELRGVIEALRSAAERGTGKVTAKMSLQIDFTYEGGAFLISTKSAVKYPDAKRARSHAWATEDGRFCPNPPNQGQFFGVRDVGARPMRNV